MVDEELEIRQLYIPYYQEWGVKIEKNHLLVVDAVNRAATEIVGLEYRMLKGLKNSLLEILR